MLLDYADLAWEVDRIIVVDYEEDRGFDTWDLVCEFDRDLLKLLILTEAELSRHV